MRLSAPWPRRKFESLNIFQYFGQKDSSNTPLPQVLLTNKLLQNERKQFNSPTAFPCVTNCNRNKHNNQDNGSCDDRNENWLGKSLMSRCRCLGHVYTEKYKTIIIKILYSVKIAPCKGMRISKSEKLWLVVFGILGFGIRNTSRQWILILYQWKLDSGFRIPIIGGFPDSLELRPPRLSWIPLYGVILNAVNKRTKPVFLRSLCGQWGLISLGPSLDNFP